MPVDNIVYRSFIKNYDKLKKVLIMPIDIIPISSSNEVISKMTVRLKALWDSGATLTAIKPELRDKLELCMVRAGSSAKIAGLGGFFDANYTVLSLRLWENFEINWCPVYVLDYSVDVDIIIGMDIIGMGDFVVCNTTNKTSFSFVIPPLPDKTDFTEKARHLNKRY